METASKLAIELIESVKVALTKGDFEVIKSDGVLKIPNI